ncbi:MAG: prenyltransferase [Pseudomonadota bacterium]
MRDGLPRATQPQDIGDLSGAIRRIMSVQRPDGAIPWFEDGPWDPWNHVECAMALNVAGESGAADAAFRFLRETQLSDGAWLGEYGNALPMVDRDFISRAKAPALKDTNFVAYPAVGLWHRFLLDGDQTAVRADWPMLQAAINFVLSLQTSSGDISWCAEGAGTDADDSLLAGNASIAKSLDCAIALGRILGEDVEAWTTAHERLASALTRQPQRFDRRGAGARFAMDWYYPVLSGALDRTVESARLEADWPHFTEPELGCRCVVDEPWVTVAETCELAIALVRVDRRDEARRLFEAQAAMRDEQGVFWMGWQMEEAIFWPREQPSWTQAAAILAADALHDRSPASRVLTEAPLEAAQHAQALHGFDLFEEV